MFNSKVVVRAGWGMYYDRGELYAYLSPGLTQNITNGGPFGINQQEPFVSTQFCPTEFPAPFIPCDRTQVPNGNQLAYPWGVPPGTQPTGDPTTVIPPAVPPSFCGVNSPQNVGAYLACGLPPFYLGAYARNNKLPYTMNSTVDIQWQPRNDLAIDIGFVNGLGRHEIIPIPFNQSRIATPTNPLCGTASVCPNPSAPFAQSYTYGYTVQAGSPGTVACPGTFFDPCPINLPNGQPMMINAEGGNVDMRVPFMGYGAESELYTAEGISAYNALQAHVEKRLSHGLQAGVSYTYSHALDEQSALGLFYNGNNPLDIRNGYGSSDFDRTHVFNIDFHYELPKFLNDNSWEGKVTNGWGIQGLIVIQSGQPYSVIDYSGAVGSIFYSIYDGITNPIDPLNFGAGCTPKNAVTGATGANPAFPALKASCFTIPLLNEGDLNGAIPTGDTFETNFTSGQRNIFRQSWQKNADLSVIKNTKLTERFTLKYTFDVYNLLNHPSFDIPVDNVSQNLVFSQTPVQGTPPVPTASQCTNTINPGTFYYCPIGLGQVTKTIGSARQIQMSLALSF
jgi:hypothetical protein